MRPIYLDAAATSGHRPPDVVEAVVQAMEHAAANPGRAAHAPALAAARLVEAARSEVAWLVGAPDPAQVALTRNATEALNIALLGSLRPGDRVLVGPWAHNALMRPLSWLARSRGVQLVDLRPTATAPLDLDHLEVALGQGARMVALSLASNLTGQALPLARVGALCRSHGAELLVDAAQGGGVLSLDVEAQGIDLLALTGHKSLYGPQGTGALWLRSPDAVQPLIRGGTGSRSSSVEHPDFVPDRFEAGTPNVSGLAGLAAGIGWIRQQGLDRLRARHEHLRARLAQGLSSLAGVTVHRGGGAGVATLSFTVQGLSTSELACALDQRQVYVRTGLHCAPRGHATLGTLPGGTVRMSASALTEDREVDEALARLEEVLSAAPRG